MSDSASDRSMGFAVAFAREVARSPDGLWCRACRDVLGVSGTGLTLLAGASTGPLCATSDEVGVLEEVQYTAGEGPCQEAFRLRQAVLAPRLDDAAFARWPSFVEAARRCGMGGVFAYPMTTKGVQVGVMTLYQRTSGDLSAQQHEDSVAMAEVLSETVLSLQREAEPDELGAGLEGDGVYRAEIHQAVGMVSVQLGIPIDDAVVRLRAHALAIDVPLSELAVDIVARRVTLADDRDE